MWRNEASLYLTCGNLIVETRAVIHPAVCVFRLRAGRQMCQLTATLRPPVTQKAVMKKKPAEEGFTLPPEDSAGAHHEGCQSSGAAWVQRSETWHN